MPVATPSPPVKTKTINNVANFISIMYYSMKNISDKNKIYLHGPYHPVQD